MKLIDAMLVIPTNGTVVVKVKFDSGRVIEVCLQREEQIYEYFGNNELERIVWKIQPVHQNYLEVRCV